MRTEDADVLNRPFQEGRTALWRRWIIFVGQGNAAEPFDLHTAGEVYLPADKRKFGYYVPRLCCMEAGLREGLSRSSTGRGILCCGLKLVVGGRLGGDMDMRESLADAWKRFRGVSGG